MKRRYCGPCDAYTNANPCKACGAETDLLPDPVCEHGTAVDVHCCADGGLVYPGCHSGFLFDIKECRCTLVQEETR